MKKIKVFALVLCAAMMATVMFGCGSSSSSTTGTSSAASGSASAASGSSASLKTVSDGVLTMGTNASFPPYEYYDGSKIVGIDAEIAQMIADKLGMTLDIQDMDFGSIISSVQGGKIDIGMAGMTVTDERKQNVDFTDSYAKGVQVVIVKDGSGIKTLDDLKGKMIGTQESTTGYIYASDTVENGGFGEDHVVAYPNGATAVQALEDGKVDAVIIDNEPAKAYVAANKGLTILDTEYVSEDYAIAISKDNPELRDAINTALNDLIKDGSVQKVLDKYIHQ
jgi:ABC-type amino acid transport substrate-binding protein